MIKRNNLYLVHLVLMIFVLGYSLSCTVSKQHEPQTVAKAKKSNKMKVAYLAFINGQYVSNTSIIPPKFTGGFEKAFGTRGYGKMRYPLEAREKRVSGTVKITLVLDKNGKIESARVKEGIGYGCDEEALRTAKRIYEKLDSPAMLDGKAVKVKFDVPINFKITN